MRRFIVVLPKSIGLYEIANLCREHAHKLAARGDTMTAGLYVQAASMLSGPDSFADRRQPGDAQRRDYASGEADPDATKQRQ